MNRFCLVDTPFVPIVGKGRVSLLDVFQREDLVDIDGTPIMKIALVKLFVAIAQASIRLEDEDEWSALGADGLSQEVIHYLETHRDCFFLYGDKPFLQMPVLLERDDVKTKSIYFDYIPDLANNNDSIFWESQQAATLHDAEKAVFIIQLMNYSLAGKKISYTPPFSPGYMEKTKSAKGGPSIGGGEGYLQTYLKGHNLKETVWLNFFTDDDIQAIAPSFNLDCRPPWEKMPEGEDDETARKLKSSVYAWLCGVSRFVLLCDDGIKITEGLIYPSVKDGYSEPFIAINVAEGEAIYVDTSKRPWRYLQALLSAIYESDDSSFRCTLLNRFWERTKYADPCDRFSVVSCGLQVSASKFKEQDIKQKDDYVESEFLFESSSLDSHFYSRLKDGMLYIDRIAKDLQTRVEEYYKELLLSGAEAKIKAKKIRAEVKKKVEKKVVKAMTIYWHSADELSSSFIHACNNGSDDVISRIKSNLRQRANKIYDISCPHKTARQISVWIKHSLQTKRKRRENE